ncbi:right-handed parallel beta-helix repeat-containing protein [Chitinophaga silvatica]|uniref:Right-handed parallel beta-helix repeat-containing protein n=1 Tax=Chitinophaga silvatica TaxID=2282649 RepID=A0A3E1Y3N2_9BACT|nr:right-handed parallel beta-helix repeat-containing protein [Chitinophaga silvatica]RFS19295.1 right-handed parallel beta-helix repeat-containing protein [Chitinophaga silvatica]
MIKRLLLLGCWLYGTPVMSQTIYHVSNKPLPNVNSFTSLNKAIASALEQSNKRVTIEVHGGTYFLDEEIIIRANQVKCQSLEISASANEKPVISAGKPLTLKWKPFKNGIYVADVAAEQFERLYVNNVPQILARYPNYDSTQTVLNGTAADALQRAAKWTDANNGYLHALHLHRWGGNSYRITKSANGKVQLTGGWQTNRPDGMNEQLMYVENNLEELDAPGEWFLDFVAGKLYYFPTKNVNLSTAKFVASNLKQTIVLKGDTEHPVRNITFKGLRFAHNERTFMETSEPLLRSDWTIYRGAALMLDGTQDCKVSNCEFEGIGGNAIMLSNYSKNDTISGCYIHHIGGNAVCLIGDPAVVRSPRDKYDAQLSYEAMDKYPGPKGNNYPQYCVVTDNLIHNIGQFEKQVAGVEVAISSNITISHNSIYDVPRAGINIGDGCFGGHIIEYNDVFNTVLETSDHGAFNSWGRDRYWSSDRAYMDSITMAHPEIILLDVQQPVTIRNNRFRCDHGWDIDLDDGSTNYRIYNNVCLNGGIKLREGFLRVVENNIMINNTFHPHVWFKNSQDIFKHNIVTRAYRPVEIFVWGKQVDYNFFPDSDALKTAQLVGTDANGKAGNPLFSAPNKGDYTLKVNSPAFEIGFKNIPMNEFGVKNPILRKITKQPAFPKLVETSYDGNEYLLKK